MPSGPTTQSPEWPQLRQTVGESQQMFEQQQQALKLMATTIGSTISKGFMMPKREYMTFNGDPLDYPSFITNFKTNVEDVESDPNVRRNYLIQLCTGKAKEAISGTVMLSPEDGFKKAKSILHEMFGQTHIVAASHIDRVTKGCVIKENESERLMQLARDMENCGMNLNKLGYQSDINSRQNISAVVLRLPRYLRSEWAKEANNLRDQSTEPDFTALTKFVVKKAKLANTEYGRLVNIKMDGDKNKPRFQGKPFRRVSVNQTSEELTRTEQGSRPGGLARMKCIFCSKDGHALEKCYKFQGKSFIERKKFVSVKGLCNICLAKGHFANKCQKGRGCFIAGCGKRHHPLLHSVESNEKRKEEEKSGKGKDKERESIESKNEEITNAQTGHCGATDMARKQVCLRVIPVRVFSKDNCQEKTTYAIRDEGSNTTLVKESLVKELNLEGRPMDFRLTTMNNVSRESGKSHHLYVQGINQKEVLEIPNALSIKNLSVARSCIPTKDDIDKWSHLNGISIPELKNHEVTILIGTDVPEAHWKLEERRGRKKEPYAIRTPLGWSVAGPMGKGRDNDASSFFIRNEDEFLTEMVERMFQLDFSELPHREDFAMSLEDKRAQSIMEDSIKVIDDHYQLDLPFREKLPFPNNREMAERRLNSLKARFKKDPDLYDKYKEGINDYVKKAFASKVGQVPVVDEQSPRKDVWYLPHHPVVHPQKPQKLRIVFDCAAQFEDVSLNKRLLQGPDMTNNLVGVLTRFREESTAFMADIEAMFCQVKVPPEHQDYLRFLWWKDGDYEQPLEEYKMRVHLFGAKSSPSCAGFCLRKAASEFEGSFDPSTIETIRKNFYVDDCLKSVPTPQKAIQLIRELCELLAKRSFRLTKFISNDRKVIDSVPETERAKSVANLDLSELPVERALGVQWNVQDDSFTFRIIKRRNTTTRRGILSDVSSMYDPLGFAAPFILPAKRLLQQLCKDRIGWDEEISPMMREAWECWLEDLPRLEEIAVPRYFKSHQLTQVIDVQLHHFSDASSGGYGCVSYLRYKDVDNQVHCSLVMGKSRVTPIKPTTIPRLELTAAVVAARQHRQIQQELDCLIDKVRFWTDSTCVLQYINNEASRFKTFVANRIETIHEISKPAQWGYVNTDANPADHASRGLRPSDKFETEQWINGPSFLYVDEDYWPKIPEGINALNEEHLEWRKNIVILETSANEVRPLDSLIQHYSSWYRLLKGVAWLTRFIQYLRLRLRTKNSESRDSGDFSSCGDVIGAGALTVDELERAKVRIVHYVQRQCFPEEVACLKPGTTATVKKSSRLSTLSPFQGKEGLLRVGGRLHEASISFDSKHPVIIPNKHHIVELIIRHFHEREGHMGARAVLATVQREFWIIGGRSRIRWVLGRCIQCRKKFSSPCEQIMAPLPSPRVTAFESPFISTGVDYFGPLMVKRGRSQVKRYGCVFTCMAVRAVHIEVAHSLDAESFLCAFSRFTARRGVPKNVYSDNGTNFVGGSRILKEEFGKMQASEAQRKINDRLRMNKISWHFNAPLASHTGGVWERMIRSVRKVLAALTSEQVVDDEALHTFLVEVERILNDRPLVRNEGDVDDLDPLTPNKLLLLRSNSCQPPGVFVGADRYGNRWRQAQLLANSFWKRWVAEYLPTLQQRQKWFKPRRNLRVKDLVLMVDKKLPRGQWPMAIVEEVFPDKYGNVRQATVRTRHATFRRDVRQLCILEGADEFNKPNKDEVTG